MKRSTIIELSAMFVVILGVSSLFRALGFTSFWPQYPVYFGIGWFWRGTWRRLTSVTVRVR